jgi:hypothetical protein
MRLWTQVCLAAMTLAWLLTMSTGGLQTISLKRETGYVTMTRESTFSSRP